MAAFCKTPKKTRPKALPARPGGFDRQYFS